MKIFKKLFVGFLAIFAGFLFSRNVFAGDYKAHLHVGQYYGEDYHVQFTVYNLKNVFTYAIDFLDHNIVPTKFNGYANIQRMCQSLLNECQKGNKFGWKIVNKDRYLELFNLSKTVESKKTKDVTAKASAYKELLTKVLLLYDVPIHESCAII